MIWFALLLSVWCGEQATFIRRSAEKYAALKPRLPVVLHLDEDFVAAARARRSIEVVDDCGGDLCGVAGEEFPDDWQLAELRALFTPPSAPAIERNAFALSLLGTFHGEDVDRWAADLARAGLLESNDPLAAVPAMASLMRFTDPKHEMPFEDVRMKMKEREKDWRASLSNRATEKPRNPATIHGATFSITNRIEKSTIAPGAEMELKRLRSLGYDAISLIPFAGQRGSAATELRRFAGSPASETDLALRIAALRAHRLGMRVMFKPHVWNAPSGDATQIDPGAEGWPAWFASYERFLIHNALLARATGAEWLVIGTELTRSESRPEWRLLIARVRMLYHGALAYAANFDAFEATPFWDDLDAIGIDAYFPLSVKLDPADDELRAGARAAVARIDAVATKFGKRVILTELGYPASAAPWIEPWREERANEPHPGAQARAFAAMLSAIAKSRSIDGFFIWKYESDPARTDPAGYLPKGKPAEAAIKPFLRR